MRCWLPSYRAGAAARRDLLGTLKELQARRVSVIALNGMTFDLSTPHGRMIATVLAGIAEFERELIQERIRSGIAAAKARGKGSAASPGSGRNQITWRRPLMAVVGAMRTKWRPSMSNFAACTASL